MSCVHFTPAQGRSRGRAPLFLIQEYPRLPGFPSDVYGIMTQRSDSARPRPYAELDQALHTLGGYVLLLMVDGTTVHVDTEFSVERTKSMVLPRGQRGVILVGDSMWFVRL